MNFTCFLALGTLVAAHGDAVPVTLIKDGKCNTAIHVAPEYMHSNPLSPKASRTEIEGEPGRVRVRESVKDLAAYLGKLTDTTVPIQTRPPAADDKTIPILIGSYADKTFAPFTTKTGFRQGYRLVVSEKGIGMQGETDEGVSYAIYELLDSLGCRWYLPGDLGEVIPRLKSVTLAAQSMQTAGLISYRRGTIQVLDRLGLEKASCECYAIVKERFDAFLTPPATAVPGHNKSRSDQTETD